MDLSTMLSLVQTILTAIQTLGLMQSVCSISYCKSELDDLQNTVQTVRAVLEDADAKQDLLSSQEKNYIQELKDVVYDADDVLDEFLTLAKQKQLKSNKVTSFFSRFKLLTHGLSSKVQMVNNKLNTIASKSDKFSFKVDFKPIKFTKEETSSFICDKIIGREEDVEKIIGVLLGSRTVDHPNVSLLAIMGMGGLGKTALAQLVYNDPRITEAFQLKRWTCIADEDEQQWSLKAFLGKVVKGPSIDDKSSLEEIHHEVKKQLGGRKYLLILDDVWTESYDQWQQFEGYLKVGGSGSWIIVTTRSKTTAQMIAGDQMHELRGLSEPGSWHLFERMAFQAEERDDELVKLGKEIVKKCTNVPLAIRVVGSLLRGQSKSKWLSFHDKGLDYLQILDLHSCSSLKKLPEDVSKLVDLSTLDIVGCDALRYVPMPAGIGMLTNLQALSQFVIGARRSSTSKQWFYGLEDLKHLNKLKGDLKIEIAVLKNAKFVKEEQGGGGYLRRTEHLETTAINFRLGREYGSKEFEQALLEEMPMEYSQFLVSIFIRDEETMESEVGRSK